MHYKRACGMWTRDGVDRAGALSLVRGYHRATRKRRLPELVAINRADCNCIASWYPQLLVDARTASIFESSGRQISSSLRTETALNLTGEA